MLGKMTSFPSKHGGLTLLIGRNNQRCYRIALVWKASSHLIHLRNLPLPMQDIPKKVTEILVEKLGIAQSEITPDANFVKDLGIDSLDYAEIVMEFEQTFDIRIPDDDAEKLQTFGQAVRYIQDKVK